MTQSQAFDMPQRFVARESGQETIIFFDVFGTCCDITHMILWVLHGAALISKEWIGVNMCEAMPIHAHFPWMMPVLLANPSHPVGLCSLRPQIVHPVVLSCAPVISPMSALPNNDEQ